MGLGWTAGNILKMATAQMTVQPVIFDHTGSPMKAKFQLGGYGSGYGGGNGWGDYEAARNSRERTLYNWADSFYPRPESEMLPMWDRLRIIAYLRRSVRNNPVMAALCFRYALAVGSPTVHAVGPDGDFNDQKERTLELRLRHIMHGAGWSWHRLHKIISTEELIAGEVFAVEVDDKVQLIPSELCGSPPTCPINEIDGIGYDMDTGEVLYYRFGKRIPNAQGSVYTRVSFLESDGAQLVDAEFVSHLGTPSRIEERRYSPRLSPVIGQIQNLDDIVKAKVTTVKNQSAMSIFFTKNFDPAMWAENSALGDVCQANAGNILGRVVARSNYQQVNNGQLMYGEVGEDVKLLEPNLNAQDFDTFSLGLLDQICAPIGIPAEEVIIGYRKSNYSSARADRNKMADVLRDVRKERESFCDRVIERQTGIAVDSGDLGNQADGITDITYGWPLVREIDETKHIMAQVAAKAAGIKSQQQLCAENGSFSDQVDFQIVQSAVLMAQTVKAFASANGKAPTRAEIKAQTVTEQEILAHMPNAQTAATAINSLANADAATVNADTNAARVNNENA